MVTTSLNMCVREGRQRVGFGLWKCVRAIFCVLMLVSGRLCGRCMSFCLTEYQRVTLPLITSIMHGWACHMCDQRRDFACMMVASPS